MTPDLIPDLLAAAKAAGRCGERHQHAAAYHLVPQTFIAPDGRRYHMAAHPELAEERAWQTLADWYEQRALRAAARGEADR